MTVTFYWYPNCGTCKKAKKWFDENGVDYKAVHIVEEPPSEEQLKDLVSKSGKPAKKFFNTSGKKYREQNMKEKLKDADEDTMIQWLASDGMLIKRPVVTDGTRVTVGFKAEEFEENWLP
ncbi:arsenate reductase family protein [Bacillus sp. SB49]|uniref:arsenate reductase family protein n=1 Tax=Bacillaceae TaxID=186817 RepID=UPI0002A4E34E|nr:MULTISPECIES: arsenate reductase family protein [Bacillaceae]ELK46999.1 MgsR/Spx family transcription regulator [Halobacillus sp. BAB-2008]QHT47549.1 arsenate reductase family protein [Bacillus sp. SB49]